MKKKSDFFSKCVCLFALISVFASCQKNYQKIDYLITEAGNGCAYAFWDFTEGDSSLLQLNIEPLPKNTKENEFPLTFNSNRHEKKYCFENLKNGITYTITLENLNSKNEIVSSKLATVTPSSDIEIYTYSKDNPFIKTTKDRRVYTLKNVKDKLITFANLNVGDNAIPAGSERRYSKAIDSRTLAVQQPVGADKKVHFVTPHNLNEYTPQQEESDNVRLALPREHNGKRSLEETEELDNFDINNPNVGTDKRKLWLDNNNKFFETSSQIFLEKKEVTLRGIGKDNGQTVCLVWVDDDCFAEEECNGKKVNADLAQNLADIFVEYYLHERDIAGQENSVDLADNKTGDAVNLVLYDIGNDYEQQLDTIYMGYFAGKDYDNTICSNVGKYLYLDTPTCNFSSYKNGKACYEGSIKDGKYVPSGMIISTIIHEFQHMIYYGKKSTEEKWYNEMLSMLMEDIMFNELSQNYGLTADDSSRGRLNEFNFTYFYNWTNSTFDAYSYAPTYAFGAWLVRNYGGIQLIQKMCSDSETGFESIVKVVNEHNGFTGSSELTKNDLLEQYLTACMINPEKSDCESLPLFNRTSGEKFESHGHTSLLLPLNIYSEENYWIDSNGNSWKGPLIFARDYPIEIPPASFTVRQGIETENEEEVTLLLTEQYNDNEEFFIYIQEPFSNQVEQ